MAAFIAENLVTILISAVLLVAVVFAIRRIIKTRKNNRCCGSCEGCSRADSCKRPEKDENKQ